MPQSAAFQPPLATFPSDWNSFFRLRCGDLPLDRLPSEFLPASTLELSQPYTCLYAMYQHKGSLQRFFANNTIVSETLTIHILGPSTTYELPPSGVWEEVMHCLPNVYQFIPVFVGPEATEMLLPPSDRMEVVTGGIECCPTCQAQGRKRGLSMYGTTYHKYCHDRTMSNNHMPPDLVVAFNTGISQEETESWNPTLQLILDLNVPAMFTSFNRQEALEYYELLSSLGAKLLTSEPTLNPVRVDMDFIDPSGTTAPFFQPNMYCICFHGRRLD